MRGIRSNPLQQNLIGVAMDVALNTCPISARLSLSSVAGIGAAGNDLAGHLGEAGIGGLGERFE